MEGKQHIEQLENMLEDMKNEVVENYPHNDRAKADVKALEWALRKVKGISDNINHIREELELIEIILSLILKDVELNFSKYDSIKGSIDLTVYTSEIGIELTHFIPINADDDVSLSIVAYLMNADKEINIHENANYYMKDDSIKDVYTFEQITEDFEKLIIAMKHAGKTLKEVYPIIKDNERR